MRRVPPTGSNTAKDPPAAPRVTEAEGAVCNYSVRACVCDSCSPQFRFNTVCPPPSLNASLPLLGVLVTAMFVARSVFAAHPPAAAEACASTRAGDSKTAQCSSWCGPAHCGSWCKCRACPTCTSPPPPPPPRSPAPPPPPRTCASKVAGDANVEGCASWCREKESAATKRVRRCWHSARPALWRPPRRGPRSLVQAPPLSRVGSLPALQVQVVRLLREQSGPLAAAFACRRRASSGARPAGCRALPSVCRS